MIRKQAENLEDSDYVGIDLVETKRSGGVLGAGEAMESSFACRCLITAHVNK